MKFGTGSNNYWLLLLWLVASSSVFAESRDSNAFGIISGDVSVTPARCPYGSCQITKASISGKFVSFMPDEGRIFFTSTALKTTSGMSFQLPSDPNFDSHGTVRQVNFKFDGTVLKIRGSIDSRAFDGPLVKYNIFAKVVTNTNSKVAFFTARPDFRKCATPMCGGYFVKAVNKKRTRCADGTEQRECYVAELDLPSKADVFSSVNRKSLFFIGRKGG